MRLETLNDNFVLKGENLTQVATNIDQHLLPLRSNLLVAWNAIVPLDKFLDGNAGTACNVQYCSVCSLGRLCRGGIVWETGSRTSKTEQGTRERHLAESRNQCCTKSGIITPNFFMACIAAFVHEPSERGGWFGIRRCSWLFSSPQGGCLRNEDKTFVLHDGSAIASLSFHGLYKTFVQVCSPDMMYQDSSKLLAPSGPG